MIKNDNKKKRYLSIISILLVISLTFFTTAFQVEDTNFISDISNSTIHIDNVTFNYLNLTDYFLEIEGVNSTYTNFTNVNDTYDADLRLINLSEDLYLYNVNTSTTLTKESASKYDYNLTFSPGIVLRTVENAAPSVTLIEPEDTYNSSSFTNTMICNNTDLDGDLANSTLYVWYGDSLESKQTKDISGSDNQTVYTDFGFVNEGEYLWNCRAVDTKGVSAWATSNYTLNIDNTNPSVNHTFENNTNQTSQDQNLTANISDNIGIKNSTLYVYNETGDLYNETTTNYPGNTTDTVVSRVVNFLDGMYNWFWKVFDWSGNSAETHNQTITVDSTAPSMEITYPQNNTAYNIPGHNISHTVSDNYIGLDTCWWTNNSGVTNNTITCGENLTVNLSEGTYNYKFYANDSFGNEGRDEVTFYISLGAPAINLNYPPANKFLNYGTNVPFNFTATDTDGLDTCILRGNFTGTWEDNYTWTSPTSGVEQTTEINLTEGNYKWNVWCNDTLGSNTTAVSNRTVNIDLTSPSVAQDGFTPTTVYNDDGVSIYGNISDTYLEDVWIEINASGAYQNVSFTNSLEERYIYELDSSYVDNHENISWRWYANDSAGNINVSEFNNFIVSNRNPKDVNVTSPANDSFHNLDYLIVNFTSTDEDGDTINYTLHNSTDGVNFDTFGSTTNNYINFTGYNSSNNATNYFYITASDGYLTNTSETIEFTMDTIVPQFSIDYPKPSPSVTCNLIDITLNYTVNDSNIDYCTFNVTSGGLVTTPHTVIPNCTNTTFNNSLDESTPIFNFAVHDKAGNVNSTSYLIRIDLDDESCPSSTTSPSESITSSSTTTTTIEPSPDTGYCGDGICQDGTGNITDRGESFYNCPEDCATEFRLPTADEAFFNCFDEDGETECIWTESFGLLATFSTILLLIASTILFEYDSDKKLKNRWTLRKTFKTKKNGGKR